MNTNRSADGDGDADGDADGKEDGEEKAGADTDKTHSSREASVIGCNTLPCTLSTSYSARFNPRLIWVRAVTLFWLMLGTQSLINDSNRRNINQQLAI